MKAKKDIFKFEDFVDDFSDLVENVATKNESNLPFFIVAHSMGSNITLTYLTNDKYTKPKNFKGIVFSGLATFVDPDVLTSTNKFLINLCDSTLPTVGIEDLDASTLSRNEEANKQYMKDKLNLVSLKAHFCKGISLSSPFRPFYFYSMFIYF